MSEPRWIHRRALELLHDESLAEHGGAPGLRDENLLESALARPLNLYAYQGTTDLARLAASYAFGIARNHPFADGNKRAALLALGLFLALNGLRLVAAQTDAYETMMRLAAGELSEEALAHWIRGASRPR
jgi:death-on-curing protein